MQIRTYVGILLGVLIVVYVSFLTPLNIDLLVLPFQLGSQLSMPLYAVLLAVFLAGLLPPVTALLVSSLKQDLSQRRQRRRSREADSFDHRFRRAVDFHVDGQFGKASAALSSLLTERPEHFATMLRAGQVQRHQGKTEEALEIHRRASVLYPRSVALLYQLAEDYDATGDVQVADEIRNRILRDFPTHGLDVMRLRRDQCMASGKWDEAVRWHDKVSTLLGDAGDTSAVERERTISQGLTYQSGVELLEKDRPDEAAAVFQGLLDQEPRFIPAGIMLGEAELLQDNEDAALDEWRRGFKRTGSPVYLQRMEDHYIEAEQPARAIETLRSLLGQAEDDLLVRFFLGRLYYRLEMHDEALKVLEAIGERLDVSPTYHFLLGRIRQRRNDQLGAVARYLTCLKRLGVSVASYVCQACGAESAEWQDRCEACGSWNSVELAFQEEQLKAEEIGVVTAPVWGGYSLREDGVPEDGAREQGRSEATSPEASSPDGS